MNRIDSNPNFIVKAMVHGAVRAYGIEALTPRLAKKHLIHVMRDRGVTGYIKIISVVRRGNPNLTQRLIRKAS